MLEEVQNKQKIASNPEFSIWTSASAGSGKTTVLVKRLLRMFLNGIEPSKVLCITFTNTGAAEMRNRISLKLAEWATFDNDKLENEIFNLEGDRQNIKEKVKIARTLFAKILDYSNDFKILTIHSFCQQIIKRFPLEASVIPNFQVADEIISAELLLKAKDEILKVKNEEIKNAIKYVFTYKNEDEFLNLLKQMMAQKDNLLYLRSKFFSVNGVIDEVKRVFEVSIEELDELNDSFLKELDLSFLSDDILSQIENSGKKTDIDFVKKFREVLKRAVITEDGDLDCRMMSGLVLNFEVDKVRVTPTLTLTPKGGGGKLIETPEGEEDTRVEVHKGVENNINKIDLKAYILIFLTQKNTIRERIITQIILKNFPEIDEFIKIESLRVFEFNEKRNNLINFQFTSAFLKITYCIFDIYSKLKREAGYLDYSDLIFETSKLLNDTKYRNDNLYSSWINYKLDDGLDHLLIDEAQDTSPIQWDIVKSITDEFFAGYGQKGEKNRTIFVVGDEKQSIFSFQGAEPKNFDLMLKYYKERVENCGRKFKNIYLETSFRSLKTILNIADLVFNEPFRKVSLSRVEKAIKHNIIRNECLGRIEILPLVGKDENVNNEINFNKPLNDDWKINYLDEIELTNKQKLAQNIVNKINDWFKNGRLIYSRKDKCERILKYSDIMILVKNRDRDFINYLIMQFNRVNIPTMGNDKFSLNENIISQDIIALSKFLLFNEDDLNFANIIKSPFLNMNENDLFNLCDYKDKNNCSLLKSFLINKENTKEYDFIKDLLDKSSKLSVYELFHYIFEKKNIRKHFRERFQYIADEIINEFLKISNEYEKSHNNTTLLNFINFIENSNLEIKRDMDQSSNEIKIMTIHSSKGLESPIVVLPDTNHTIRTIQKIDSILNYKNIQNDYTIPILQKEKTEFSEKIKDSMKNETEEEYIRLLYVAITRAENELYICDYKRKGKIKENSWYGILKSTLESINFKSRKDENFEGETLWFGDEYEFSKNKTFFNNELKYESQVDKIISTINSTNKKRNEIKIINPSTYYTESYSRFSQENSTNLENGKLVHKLLEILPEINKEEHDSIVDTYLKNNKNASKIKSIVSNILNNKNFSFLFDNNSKAEVSIFGRIEENIISAKIDRMSIIDDTIYIVDYKNTINLTDKIPQKYIKQLELYKKLIEKIYLNKKVICYILWTSFGKMEKIIF